MLSDDTSTDVLSSLLQHCKLQVSYVMAGGWPAFCSLARGMEATPCGLSEASIAVHWALISITDGIELREKLPETELWEGEGKGVLQL